MRIPLAHDIAIRPVRRAPRCEFRIAKHTLRTMLQLLGFLDMIVVYRMSVNEWDVHVFMLGTYSHLV